MNSTCFPNNLAQALKLKKDEIVEWELVSIDTIKLNRVTIQKKEMIIKK